jgi:Tfp pilus assembly protein PilO
MKSRVSALPTRALVAIALGAVLLYALVVWFLVVSPKRSEAAALAEDVISAELELGRAQLEAKRPHATAPGTQASDVLGLAKAMPSQADQPGLVLELDRLGRSAGITIGSITPRDLEIDGAGAATIPVVVTAEGSYRQITRFLARAKGLVLFRRGRIRAKGRLLTLQAVELAESNAHGFPLLDATITLNAFVYDGPIAPPAQPPSTSDEDEDVSTGASAAGSVP